VIRRQFKSITEAVKVGEREGRRVFINSDQVASVYVDSDGGFLQTGVHVQEPGYEDNFTDVNGRYKDGRVWRTRGRRSHCRRIFDEYDVWEGYRGRPIISSEDSTMVRPEC
jgi:hypothetical protein